MLSRRQLIQGASSAALSATAPAALAQGYPSKPIRIIVPAGSGDSCDILSRLIAPKLTERLGQAIVIDNRAGSAGQLGLTLIKQAAPDGYTLGCGQGGNMVIVPLAYSKVAYDSRKDFTPVAMMASNFLGLVVSPKTPFKTVQELIDYGKANPGKLTFGSPGNGTAVHLAGEALADAAGFQFTHVPHRGLAPALTAVMGGFVDVVIGAPGVIHAQVEAGKLRPIAQFGATRAAALGNLPTLKEQGIDLALRADFGFFAPKGLPADVVQRLNEALQKAIDSEEFKSFVAVALVAPAFLNASDYQAVVDSERAIYARVVPKLALGNR